ncbi:hypothetical protein CON39_11925 [Bacillus thuringiensis]|uniref:hypothetical protein n=1 Tax=Bacillus thuringiensis TaxID=1428 RepID=UPI000BEC072C|nr:hypothetical protein [Bacillus thuringiensis]PEF30372.1 hypothetical protein CON39_11925 [Bacillus thuringiensis]
MTVSDRDLLESCRHELELMVQNHEFWEHFRDHISIAIPFFLLGLVVSVWIFSYVLRSKIKFDYDIPKGTVMRIKHKDKKWFIVRPNNTMQCFDILLLCVLDKGKDKFIDEQDKRRIRRTSWFILSLVIILVVIGCLYIMSAFAFDLNPVNHMDEPLNKIERWFIP